MALPDRHLAEYLRDHDVSCFECGYNIRGVQNLVCPECGHEQPYKDMESFHRAWDEHILFEGTEYGLYRFVTRWLTGALIFNGIAVLYRGDRYEMFDYQYFAGALFAMAIINAWMHWVWYSVRAAKRPYFDRRLNPIRDAYGAVSMIGFVVSLAGVFVHIMAVIVF